jgi:hypothetical protein
MIAGRSFPQLGGSPGRTTQSFERGKIMRHGVFPYLTVYHTIRHTLERFAKKSRPFAEIKEV